MSKSSIDHTRARTMRRTAELVAATMETISDHLSRFSRDELEYLLKYNSSYLKLDISREVKTALDNVRKSSYNGESLDDLLGPPTTSVSQSQKL